MAQNISYLFDESVIIIMMRPFGYFYHSKLLKNSSLASAAVCLGLNFFHDPYRPEKILEIGWFKGLFSGNFYHSKEKLVDGTEKMKKIAKGYITKTEEKELQMCLITRVKT